MPISFKTAFVTSIAVTTIAIGTCRDVALEGLHAPIVVDEPVVLDEPAVVDVVAAVVVDGAD
jgi:hypothetical protein